VGALTAGSIILIPFSFSDLSNTKLRPAVVLATLDKDDCILCQITSKPYDNNAVELNQIDFKEGSLQRVSYARPGKLFTANASLLQNHAGQLTENCFMTVREQVVKIIRGEVAAIEI
jgi:mRNA interferase MazF